MIHPAIPPSLLASLLALTAPAAAGLQESGSPDGVEFAQLSVHERIIIRVPRMSVAPKVLPGRTPMARPPEWREHKGPKCVAVADIAGAMLGAPGAVDLLMANGTRLRAKLDGDCNPLDYYSGFYIRPAADGQICGNRDIIRMRSGTRCDIDGFKTLRVKN